MVILRYPYFAGKALSESIYIYIYIRQGKARESKGRKR